MVLTFNILANRSCVVVLSVLHKYVHRCEATAHAYICFAHTGRKLPVSTNLKEPIYS